MAYTRTTYVNGSGGGTPVSAANLNNSEVELVALDFLLSDPATTLPGSPANRQVAVLTDSTTAPTYEWVFRYNTTIADANKWMLVGGSAKIVEVATSETTASTSYADLATVGPTFTVPRAGVYEFVFGGEFANGALGAQVWISHTNGGTAATDAAGIQDYMTAAAQLQGGRSRVKLLTVAAASDVVKLQYRVSSNTGTFAKRFMWIRPVRVA